MVRIAAVMLALGQSVGPVTDAVEGAHTLPNGGKVEVLGICRIDAEAIACWDRTGKADTTLTSRIEAHYLPDMGQDVQVRPGYKNRYVVFRRTNSLGLNVTDAENRGVGTAWSRSEAETLEWARFLIKPADTAFDAFVNLSNVNELDPFDVPFERGKSVEFLGTRFEIGDSRPLVPPKGGAAPTGGQSIPPGGKAWGIYWGQRVIVPSTAALRFVAVDKNGQVVRFVDKNGQPISEAKFLESIPKDFTDTSLWKGTLLYQNAQVALTGGSGGPEGAFLMQTNVNPGRIGAIRIFASEKLRLRFPNLPTDPM